MGALWGELGGGLLYWELWKLVLISTQRQATKLISGPSPTVKTSLLSLKRTQSRVVIGFFIGHNALRRYFCLMGLANSPLCRRRGAQEETSAHVFCECEASGSLRRACLGPFSWIRRMLRASNSGGQLQLQDRNRAPMTFSQIMGQKGSV